MTVLSDIFNIDVKYFQAMKSTHYIQNEGLSLSIRTVCFRDPVKEVLNRLTENINEPLKPRSGHVLKIHIIGR